MTDPINHPPHYLAHPSGVECIQIAEHMGFNLGNAIKYIWRADLKGNALEDLKKAVWSIEREIARREKKERSYCAARKPQTAFSYKPIVDWDEIEMRWNCLAVNSRGEGWFYETEPLDWDEWFHISSRQAEDCEWIPGTCNWRDSLVKRTNE
jgi:hypothetical protein